MTELQEAVEMATLDKEMAEERVFTFTYPIACLLLYMIYMIVTIQINTIMFTTIIIVTFMCVFVNCLEVKWHQ